MLTILLTSHENPQLPPNFKNITLPLEIYSWLYFVLEKIPVKMARQVEPKTSELVVGIGRRYSSETS